ARGLRILPVFAGFCRGYVFILCLFSGSRRFPKPLVGCSTHPGATTLSSFSSESQLTPCSHGDAGSWLTSLSGNRRTVFCTGLVHSGFAVVNRLFWSALER